MGIKLVTVPADQVVRHLGNGSHYKFVRPEKSRARIRPLELFPSGLLIPKAVDTIVDPDIEVALIGLWQEGLVVEGRPTHSRAAYELELDEQRLKLVILEDNFAALPAGGKGKFSKGSWANKLKATRSRIEVLERGLGFVSDHAPLSVSLASTSTGRLKTNTVVQLPSGRAAMVMGFRKYGTADYARIKTSFNGDAITASLPCSAMRPWRESSVCTC